MGGDRDLRGLDRFEADPPVADADREVVEGLGDQAGREAVAPRGGHVAPVVAAQLAADLALLAGVDVGAGQRRGEGVGPPAGAAAGAEAGTAVGAVAGRPARGEVGVARVGRPVALLAAGVAAGSGVVARAPRLAGVVAAVSVVAAVALAALDRLVGVRVGAAPVGAEADDVGPRVVEAWRRAGQRAPPPAAVDADGERVRVADVGHAAVALEAAGRQLEGAPRGDEGAVVEGAQADGLGDGAGHSEVVGRVPVPSSFAYHQQNITTCCQSGRNCWWE